jgi:hypothetical protein
LAVNRQVDISIDFSTNPQIWVEDDPFLHLLLFNVCALAVYLKTKFETFLRELERNWMINVYLAIHEGPLSDGSAVRALLQHFRAHSNVWSEIAADLSSLPTDMLKMQFLQLIIWDFV